MPKGLKHVKLSDISDILLEYFKALFYFTDSENDMICAIK